MDLVPADNAVLHETAKEVTDIEAAIKTAGEMYELLKKHDDGFAISAPQVGQSTRIFVFFDGSVYINPEILSPKNSATKIPPRAWNKPINMGEGCLTYPGTRVEVPRWESIKVRYINKEGKVIEERLKGISAMAFQHELDHLNGITIMDHYKTLQENLTKFHKNKEYEQPQKIPSFK